MTIQPSARPRPPLNLFESGFASPEEAVAHAERMIASRKRLDVPDSELGLVRIIHGANEDVLPLGGQHVGRVRHELSGLFNIAPNAPGKVGGRFVPENYLLREGETLEFTRPFGRKGVGQVWTKDEFCNLFTMGEADFEAMVARGLPVHRLGDDSIRITETEFDSWSRHEEPWLFTVQDLAVRLNVSERVLWRMRSSGKLPEPIELGPKLIRWGRSEILDWIALGCPNQKIWGVIKAKRPRQR
ncbi:helix-turn-helix transcriptional regulator [Tundrisphaera sp. TA3]|uniref:helix-turn-helix transcriptional regulator n=1 Tax=Tundrisphaera sp. TA3 TaxID=3435775 RepID=UPI003EC0BC71